MKPSETYWLPYGEKKVLSYFLKRELKERHEEKVEEMKAIHGG